ncbi:MAG: hypothetical protein M1827_007488 [Pycnora praestabilis]|nr:MAG: hypothetical protein M1827_007488 [Pycnora praestabilis]
MDPQFGLASRDDLWRLQLEMKNVHTAQAEHADRLLRLERRQDDDARMKSVWGNTSSFPGVLSGTPQQDPVRNPAAEAFQSFDHDQQHNLLGSLHLDNDDEPRRGASRANSVRFDETAIHGHLTQGSRSSSDFFPARTGSGLGGHAMNERSSSHKSDGRQSSAGQSSRSVHSAQSMRTNSLGLDTSFLLSQAANTTSVEPIGPPAGLFILGSVPSIIRCWLDTNFSHDTLLYAAICSGSYKSFLDAKLISRLGLQNQLSMDHTGQNRIKIPVYLPEAVVQTPSSRSSSPAPRLPNLSVDFTVISQYRDDADSSVVQIIIGSDVLKAHNADILFSQNSIHLFDDNNSKLSIPLVRPENDLSFKNLCTRSIIPHIDRDAQQLRAQGQTPTAEARIPRDFFHGNDLGATKFDEMPRRDHFAQSSSPASSPVVLTSAENSVIGEGRKSTATNNPGGGNEKVSELRDNAVSDASNMRDSSPSFMEGPADGELQEIEQHRQADDDALDSPIPPQGLSSGIWGSWRRDSAHTSKPDTTGSNASSSSGYQRAGRGRGMKVLKPVKSTMSPSARSFSATQPAVGFDAALPRFPDENRRKSQSGGSELKISTQHESSNFASAEAKTASPARDIQLITNKPRSANPLGGASAFTWFNPGQPKRSTSTAEGS